MYQPVSTSSGVSLPFAFYKVLYDVYRGIQPSHLLQFRPFVYVAIHIYTCLLQWLTMDD